MNKEIPLHLSHTAELLVESWLFSHKDKLEGIIDPTAVYYLKVAIANTLFGEREMVKSELKNKEIIRERNREAERIRRSYKQRIRESSKISTKKWNNRVLSVLQLRV